MSAACLAGLLLLAPGPAAAEPFLAALREREPKVPVLFIPGITGSKLRERSTGKVIWGRAGNLFGPRDGGRALALSVLDPPTPGTAVEAFGVIERLGMKIYGPLLRTLEAHGYVRGDLRAPRPDDTLLVFPHDWRYGSVEAAGELAGLLENLRRVRGEETLRVVFICHSNAGRIARWYVKYGGADLETAAAGAAAPSPRVDVDKVLFVGTAQGGALPTLLVLDRGRKYVPLLGRKLRPEYLFTMPGLFEALPAWRDDLFVDPSGRVLDVDLFDAASWRYFGWSIHGAAARGRLAAADAPDELLGGPAERQAWLERVLARSREMHVLLMRDVPGFAGVRYYQVQNTYAATPSRAVLVRDGAGEWRTLTSRDKRVRRDGYLRSRASAPGDGHATRESQEQLSPQERAAVAAADLGIPARHRGMVAHRAARARILEYLLD